jgi:hypothetical protein
MNSSITHANPLSPGTHTYLAAGLVQRHHVHGNGPVCVAHSGGPGIFWEYMRMPALEKHLTMVYVEPIGTAEDSRLPSHPHGLGIASRRELSTALTPPGGFPTPPADPR